MQSRSTTCRLEAANLLGAGKYLLKDESGRVYFAELQNADKEERGLSGEEHGDTRVVAGDSKNGKRVDCGVSCSSGDFGGESCSGAKDCVLLRYVLPLSNTSMMKST